LVINHFILATEKGVKAGVSDRIEITSYGS